ncbi:MAG: 2'-hydroxybiphenyl-2-sulfinate desulfinase [Pseudomonadota bacterium]|nr:2'-hydroxybiphenyl-2-sulfinate desulfinase [Pseudomonadota bacterium]
MRTIYYSNCPVPNAFLLAVKKFGGEFEARGLRFDLLPPDQSATHFAFDHPGYSRFGGEIPPLLSEAVRRPGATRLIGLTRCHSRQGLLVRVDSELRTPEDLRGRHIGITANGRAMLDRTTARLDSDDPWDTTQRALGTWEARGLLSTLAAGGLTLDDISLVEVRNPWAAHRKSDAEASKSFAPSDLFPDATSPAGNPQLRALNAGEVDAVFSFLPYLAQSEQDGWGRLLFDLAEDPMNDYVSTWTVSAALLDDAPEVVQAAVDVVVQAARWARQQPGAARQLHAENFGVSEAAVSAALGQQFHLGLEPLLDDTHLEQLDRTQAFLVSRGILPQPVDLNAWVAPEFLARNGSPA